MTEKNSLQVQQSQGAGGKAMEDFLHQYILDAFGDQRTGPIGLQDLDDGATVEVESSGDLVLTTDSHTVQPLFFPGGDIGALAVSGTVNDLAVMGASSLALTSSLVIEEGFSIDQLKRILHSMKKTADQAGTQIITGDTKVIQSGDMDGLIINTAGIGLASPPISDAGASFGDKVILTGTVGDHGMALLQYREGLSFESQLESDIAPINGLLQSILDKEINITAMKDPTRGGLANSLNELAEKSGVGIIVSESSIPLRDGVEGIANLLGISPYNVANEGKAILTVASEDAQQALQLLQNHPLGTDAAVIGEVVEEWRQKVILETSVGGRRFLEQPLGDPVPRIC